jgi:NAD(P)-dependent dehydrogenase (short-subunit alcohol dehydrogenase family)
MTIQTASVARGLHGVCARCTQKQRDGARLAKENVMGFMRNLVLAGGVALLGRELRRRASPANLAGQTALVTGGSRGLGLLVSRELARAGCDLAICARDGDELERARADLALHGGRVETFVCDVSRQDEVERMIGAVTARLGQIDILVNNAGVIQVGPLENQTIDDFRMALDVMYWGTVYPTLAVLPQMRARRGGRIVNVTSIGGKMSVPHLLPYSSAKFAAVGFSEGLAAEVAKDGIAVTTVVPGLMRTGSHLHAVTKGQHEAEYGWFSLGASVPLISMDAEQAAKQIVEAARRGESVTFLGITAALASRFHGLFPGTTVELLGLVNRLLPSPAGRSTVSKHGYEARERLNSPLIEFATTLGRRAAERFNETRPTTQERQADGTRFHADRPTTASTR